MSIMILKGNSKQRQLRVGLRDYSKNDINAFYKLAKASRKNQPIFIYEYDQGEESSDPMIYQTGLQPQSLGIFRDEVIQSSSERLKNTDPLSLNAVKEAQLAELSNKMFQKKINTPHYFATHRLYYNHMSESHTATYFTYLVIGLNKSLERNIDIVYSGTEPLSLDRNFLMTQGFSAIEIYSVSPDYLVKKEEITLSSDVLAVKKLRLFHGSFIHSDIQKIILLSDPLKGCTGDQSFSEVSSDVSAIPVYEIRRHKRIFAEGIATLLKDFPLWSKYLNVEADQFLNVVFEEDFIISAAQVAVLDLLESPEVFSGIGKVFEKNLSKEFNFNVTAVGLVKMHLLAKENSVFKEHFFEYQKSSRSLLSWDPDLRACLNHFKRLFNYFSLIPLPIVGEE